MFLESVCAEIVYWHSSVSVSYKLKATLFGSGAVILRRLYYVILCVFKKCLNRIVTSLSEMDLYRLLHLNIHRYGFRHQENYGLPTQLVSYGQKACVPLNFKTLTVSSVVCGAVSRPF